MKDKVRYLDALNRPIETRVTKHKDGYIIVSEKIGDPETKRILASYPSTYQPMLHSRGIETTPIICFDLKRDMVVDLMKELLGRNCPPGMEDSEDLPWTEKRFGMEEIRRAILSSRSRYLFGYIPALYSGKELWLGDKPVWSKMCDKVLVFFNSLVQEEKEDIEDIFK